MHGREKHKMEKMKGMWKKLKKKKYRINNKQI
jgi:hypothetical protein